MNRGVQTSAGKFLEIQTDITDYRGISYVTFLLNNYHCTICKSKLLSGTEYSFRRALVLNNSVTLVLTLFRLGFFGQSVTGGGGSSDPPPPSVSLEPIMLGSWNLHTMIISVQKSPTLSFDSLRPMMTSQRRHIRFYNASYYFST